ncbi:AI-2E family transporter [Limnobacter humi]|uniref:AI-2E family transporter n=1 Tax=Limnobacter humi TaxID=1778671 RepID=A0ABT1WD30_9BURK|nr:AI-2E family transporter [Limnobacter humi]MCQ8895429.1 AI-2E family transporter [Limnobacter humi]
MTNPKIALSDLVRQFYQRHWGLLLTLALVLAGLVALWSVLAPFVAAFFLAYLMANPSRWVYKKLRGRLPLSLCAVLTFVLLVVVLLSFGLLFIPVVNTQLELIENNLPQLLLNIKQTVLPWLQQTFGWNWAMDSETFRAKVALLMKENRDSLAELSTALVRSGSASVLGITGFVSLTVISTLFILPGWLQMSSNAKQFFPPHVWKRFSPLLREMDEVLGEYVKGVVIVIAFLSVYYSVGLSLAGLKSGWAIGILAGLLSIVPYLGLTVAMVVAVLTSALELQGVWPIAWVLLVFVSGQLIEGFVLTPMVVGDKIGLSALAVIFALAFFGALFGLVGVFLALPLAAIAKVVYQHTLAAYQASAYYQQGLNKDEQGR